MHFLDQFFRSTSREPAHEEQIQSLLNKDLTNLRKENQELIDKLTQETLEWANLILEIPQSSNDQKAIRKIDSLNDLEILVFGRKDKDPTKAKETFASNGAANLQHSQHCEVIDHTFQSASKKAEFIYSPKNYITSSVLRFLAKPIARYVILRKMQKLEALHTTKSYLYSKKLNAEDVNNSSFSPIRSVIAGLFEQINRFTNWDVKNSIADPQPFANLHQADDGRTKKHLEKVSAWARSLNDNVDNLQRSQETKNQMPLQKLTA